MRMTTGLALDETNSGFDPASQMVYLHDDMAGFAVNAAVVAPPGTRWAYSSPTTQLLARIVRDAVGGPEQTLAFAWRELFNPLGMRNVTLEFDASGTLQGSTYMLASARDWAKFGLLYLNDGIVGGKRILHEDWVDFSAAATLDTDYAAGFWTNRSEHPNAKGRVRLGIPRDAFFASGDLGQRIVIMPSQRLVVVRLGDSVDPTGDIKRGLGRLVKEVIAAPGASPCRMTVITARPRTARPFPARAHRPAGRECVRETPSLWDDPPPARHAPRRPPAESSSGCRRR